MQQGVTDLSVVDSLPWITVLDLLIRMQPVLLSHCITFGKTLSDVGDFGVEPIRILAENS